MPTFADLLALAEQAAPILPPAAAGDGSAPQLTVIEADDDPDRLARVFLDQYASDPVHGHTLKWWRDEWWQWDGTKYVRQPDLICRLHAAVKKEFNRLNILRQMEGTDGNEQPTVQKITRSLERNVESALQSMTNVGHDTEQMTWLDWRLRDQCVSLSNGILDIDHLMAGREDCLVPHNPLWFSSVCLPYAFDPEADCPTWKQMLEQNLEGDAERIKLLQEWAGYLITADTSQQKFMVLEGDGANGKSVYMAGVTAMLGRESVSNISLELFGQRFMLTETLGKLANISTDMGEVDKVAEGHLKSFTSGDRMFFDRKGIPGLSTTPTARLMAATNNRPRFTDRSSGVWRRMILVPFRREIADGKRVRGADRTEFWVDNGEVSGIFNWAIAGLHRLRQQGGFTKSKICEAALDEYRKQNNPARNFLLECCEETDSAAGISCSDLYREYARWCTSRGYRPLGEAEFGKEVKRCFKNCERKRNRESGERIYRYYGVATSTI